MVTRDDRRKMTEDFLLIGTGPWLRDISATRCAKQVIAWSVVGFTGAVVMDWGPIAFIAVIGLVGGLAALGVQAATRNDWQHCPECLKGMAAGAVVCPWCGLTSRGRDSCPTAIP